MHLSYCQSHTILTNAVTKSLQLMVCTLFYKFQIIGFDNKLMLEQVARYNRLHAAEWG